MFTEQLPDLLDYVNSLPGFVCLVSDMNIHFDNPLQSLTKQTLSTLSLYSLVQVKAIAEIIGKKEALCKQTALDKAENSIK